MTGNVWTFIEQEGGVAHPVSWELLGAAQKLSASLPAAPSRRCCSATTSVRSPSRPFAMARRGCI